ncbi:PLU-1-like protein-domain-containing protein [Scheffersomyces coipomensis]|uniref:PLU-1-like protein-domain-containing protein n=1 Tax=Scheffersomyces coipomensis TaxID=1788519 RepID=UPI00315C8ABE
MSTINTIDGSTNHDSEISKFPHTSRFFNTKNLPDLRTYQFTRDNKPISLNGQSTGINYNPYNHPQSKTKANIPLDFYNLPTKISINHTPIKSEQQDSVSGREIPYYELNDQQSKDPIRFIESVADEGKNYGAVKIKLNELDHVKLIKSKIQINSDLFWFETNKLLNNPNQNELLNRLKFQHELIEFHCLYASENDHTPPPSKTSTITTEQTTITTPLAIKKEFPNTAMSPSSINRLLNSPSPAIRENSIVTTPSTHINDSETDPSSSSTAHTPTSTANTFDSPKRKPIPPFLLKLPMVDKRPLDVYKLFRSVMIRGGFSEVINKKLWAQIGRELGYKGKIMTSLSSSLKSSYQRILYPFELYLQDSRMKSSIMKLESHKREGDESIEGEPDLKKVKLDNGSSAPLILGSAKEFKRSIKSKGSKGFIINSPHLVEVKPPNTFVIKSEESTTSTSTSKKNRKSADKIETPILPQSQLKRSLKFLIDNQSHLEDKSRMKSNINSSFYTLRQFMEKDLKFQEFIIENHPDIFKNGSSSHPHHNHRHNDYSNCNNNNNGYAHDNDRKSIDISQLEDLFLKFINNQTKFDSLGMDDGLELECGIDIPNYINGSAFVQLGDDVAKYKSSLHNLTIMNSTTKATNAAMNAVIGRNESNNGNSSNINNPINQMTNVNDAAYFNSPEYISNIISSALFPWNLHNLPILPNSLFGSFTDSDLNNKELVNSRLNIGMTFSLNNWTCEDHFTNLINYQFFGAVKRWYFIPESDFTKFEQLVKDINDAETTRLNINNNVNWQVDQLKQYFVDHPFVDYDNLIISLENMINPISDSRSSHINKHFQSLIDLKTNNNHPLKLNQEFFITPQLLSERGIKFTTTLQKPGEFIMKLPKTYSACVSYGFNLSEEVNFATKDWLDYALEAETWLSNQSIIPNFSTFKLLINLIQIYDSGQNIGFSSEIYNKIRPMYDELLENELELRNKIRKLKIKEVSIDEKQFSETDMIADDDLSNVFPSKVIVIEIKTKQSFIMSMASFLQYQEMNKLDPKLYNFELHLFYSDDKLRNLAKLLSNYSIDYQSWMKKYIELMQENSDVSLKSYRTLLSEGERILSAIESTTTLNSTEESIKPDDEFDLFKSYIINLRYFINKSNEFIEECQHLLSIKHQQRIRNGNEYRQSSDLKDLFKLVDKIPNLNFSCTEIDQVLEFKNEIENFDKACRTLLSKKNKPIQEFDDLINLGESFGLEIPSLTFITRIRDRLNWIKVYNLIQKGADPLADKKEVFTFDKLQEFFNKGLSILSKEDLDMIKDIELIVNNSEEFDLDCGEFLTTIDYVENYNMEKLTTIAERFRTEKLFITMTNYIELSKLQFNAKLIAQFNQFKHNPDERLTYADAKQIHNSINESGLKFNEIILTNEINKTEEFINQLWLEIDQVKIITTLSKDVDLDHLNSRLTMNTKLVEKLYQILYKSEFALSEDDIYENSSSFNAKFSNADDDNENDPGVKFYCLCREYEYGTMIECDKCNEWYHISCVGEQVNNADDDNYLCPLCKLIESNDGEDVYVSKQFTLSRCLELKNLLDTLKVYPGNESRVVNEINETIQKYQHSIRNKMIELNNVDNEVPLPKKIDKLKYFLRKIYGSGVFLNELFVDVLKLVRVKEGQYNAWLATQKVNEVKIEVVDDLPTEKVEEVKVEPIVEASASEAPAFIEQIISSQEPKVVDLISPDIATPEPPQIEQSPLDVEPVVKVETEVAKAPAEPITAPIEESVPEVSNVEPSTVVKQPNEEVIKESEAEELVENQEVDVEAVEEPTLDEVSKVIPLQTEAVKPVKEDEVKVEQEIKEINPVDETTTGKVETSNTVEEVKVPEPVIIEQDTEENKPLNGHESSSSTHIQQNGTIKEDIISSTTSQPGDKTDKDNVIVEPTTTEVSSSSSSSL